MNYGRITRECGVMDGHNMFFAQVRHNSFMQMPTEEEAKEGFTKAFEDLVSINSNVLLNERSEVTHLSFGFHQDG